MGGAEVRVLVRTQDAYYEASLRARQLRIDGVQFVREESGT